jgi:tetratricopeptide (TPR) repeat protein
LNSSTLPTQCWRIRAALLALCVGHVTLGLGLFSGWVASGKDLGFSPLYHLLNAALPPQALRVLQSGVGALGLVAVYLLGVRLLSPGAGLLSAGLLAVASPVLLAEATLEPALWGMVLCLAGIALLARARTPAGFEVRWLAGAGLLLGLAGAARPLGLLVLVFAVAWVDQVLKGHSSRQRLAAAAALLAAGGLTFGAMTFAGNATSPRVGVLLYSGNRPESTGLGASHPSLLLLYSAQLRMPEPSVYERFALAEGLLRGEPGLYWAVKTNRFATLEPGTFLGLLGRKLAFFLFGPDPEVRQLEKYPLPGTLTLTLLGLAGLMAALWRRERLGPLLIPLAASTLLALLFFVTSHHRLAALPVWALLAGGLAMTVWRERRSPRRLGAALLPLAVCLPLPWLFPFIHEVRDAIEREAASTRMADGLTRALQAGHYDEATRLYQGLLASNPFTAQLPPLRGVPFESPELAARVREPTPASPMEHLFEAERARLAGSCDAALAAAGVAEAAGYLGARSDTLWDPALVAADCLLRRGDTRGAMSATERSLDRRGGTLDALAFAIAGAELLPQEYGRRRADWEGTLFSLHDWHSARYARARARVRWGRFQGALEDADLVLALEPDLAPVRYVRATALSGLGRHAEAAADYARALALLPSFNFPTAPMESTVAARLAEAPDSPDVLALAAEHHLRAGRLELARELARRAPQDARLAALTRELASARPSGITVPPPP